MQEGIGSAEFRSQPKLKLNQFQRSERSQLCSSPQCCWSGDATELLAAHVRPDHLPAFSTNMEALLSAPRRSPAVPNKSGTKALYTETTHNYQDHRSTTRIWVLDLKSRQRSLFSEDPSVRDIIWAGIDDEVLWTQQGEHGKIDFWFGDATSSSRYVWGTHLKLVAGKVQALTVRLQAICSG